MAVCGTGISSISTVDGISGVILPPTQVIVEKLAEQIEFSHLAQSLRDRISVITNLENGLTQVNSLVTSETGILAQELLALRNDLTGAVAYINDQVSIDVDQREAMVQSINTLMAGFDGKIAALEEKSTVQADINGALLGEKTVKIDLAGNVAGYGLSAYIDPEGNFDSDFQIRADTFSISPPAINSPMPPTNPYHGMVWVDTSLGVNQPRWYNSENEQWSIIPVKGAVPFVVKTSPETIDGITIPPGVYIDSAYIGRISANQIDTRGLVIRDTEANGGGILFGAGNALDWALIDGTNKPEDGATVGMLSAESSTVYTLSNGWSLNKNGSFSANGGGNSIAVSTNAASINFKKSDGTTAFAVDQTGSAIFGGSLLAATGTFSGSLAAGVLDSAAFDSIKYTYTVAGSHPLSIPSLRLGWTSMHMRITVVGAGGGGGGGSAAGAPNRNPTSSGGGGGAGQKNVYVVTSGVTPGSALSIVVGQGGSGGAGNTSWNGSSANATAGSAGGSSSVTKGASVYSASGGAGGGAGTTPLADSTLGGAGGSIGGQSGTGGFAISAAGGAGGSSEVGSGGNGGGASYRWAGSGSNGGTGAGGGGGGADASHSDYGYAGAGGAGGNGYVLVEFYDPNTIVLNSRYSALVQWLDGIGHGAVPSAAR